jgi:hypothetical protein
LGIGSQFPAAFETASQDASFAPTNAGIAFFAAFVTASQDASFAATSAGIAFFRTHMAAARTLSNLKARSGLLGASMTSTAVRHGLLGASMTSTAVRHVCPRGVAETEVRSACLKLFRSFCDFDSTIAGILLYIFQD